MVCATRRVVHAFKAREGDFPPSPIPDSAAIAPGQASDSRQAWSGRRDVTLGLVGAPPLVFDLRCK